MFSFLHRNSSYLIPTQHLGKDDLGGMLAANELEKVRHKLCGRIFESLPKPAYQ